MRAVETTFLLIRHAESLWNASGRWQGHGDPPLSPRGRGQAARLAARLAAELAAERPQLLFASDLRRAAQTAAALAAALALPVRPDPRLRELDVGAWTGLTREQIGRAAGPRLARFDAGELDLRPGGGETRRELGRRARSALAAIAAEHPGRRIAVVTHQGVVRALLPDAQLAHCQWRRLGVGAIPASE